MAIAKKIIQQIDKEIESYAEKMETIVKSEVHIDSGALRDSITTEKKTGSSYLVGVDAAKLKSDARNASKIDYSVPYHDGHRAYTVRAKKAKVLSWIGKDGQRHFAKSVRIPASAGDPFIERAVLKRPKI